MQLSQFCCGVYLFSCLNPFHHFAPDDGFILLSCSLPRSTLSPSPFLIFSHFLSIPSPLHSHQSVLVQINFPKPISFYRQLSTLITIFFVLCLLYSILLMWFLFLFSIPSISFASLSFVGHDKFFFFIILLLHFLHSWCWSTINLFAFRWMDKNIAYERAKSHFIPKGTYHQQRIYLPFSWMIRETHSKMWALQLFHEM